MGKAHRASMTAAGVDHEQRAVHERAQEGRVGHSLERRAVDHDEVRSGTETLQDRPHPLGSHQLGRIGRQGARREDPEVRLLGRVVEAIRAHVVAAQHRRQPVRVGQVEDLVDARLSQVPVHQEDPEAGLGEHDGKVGGRDRLALARDRARHEQRANWRGDGSELDVRSERPVVLRGTAARVQERRQPVHLLATLVTLHPWDRAQRGQVGDLPDGLGVLDRVIEVLHREGDPQGQEQAEHGGERARSGVALARPANRAPRPAPRR